MEIIGIGDIHGSQQWRKVIAKEKHADKIIFIADYFDSFYYDTVQQISNFKSILKLKEDFPDKVELLIGNHCYHYFPYVNEIYAGFQPWAKTDIGELLHNAVKAGLMKMCHIEGNYLFTHAGITKTWCEKYDIDLNNLEESINDLFIYKPHSFKFCGHDMSGNDKTQSPIWVRPESLLQDKIDVYTHVVGHTEQKQVMIYKGMGLILIDTLSLSGQYLKITDGNPIACKS